jgi:hypothetical protein
MPAIALCDDAPKLTELPKIDQQKKVYLLFGPGATGISISHLDNPSYLVLSETKRAVAIKSLLSRLGTVSASARRAQEILSESLENGALMIVG